MKIKEILRKLYYFKVYNNLKSKGANIRLSSSGSISRPQELSIGSNVFIGRGFNISARNMVIGNNVMIGPSFLAECDDHIFNKVGVTLFENREEKNIKEIEIENDVWIGGNVTVLKGVRIREGCVIGAGSILTKSVPPYSICYGNPCIPKKTRFNKMELRKHLLKQKSKYTFEQIVDFWKLYHLD